MTDNTTLQYYFQNADDFIKNTLNVDMSAIQDKFAALLPPNAQILDLGCGSGRDSLAFLQKGYSVTALDGCPEFCKATENLCAEYKSSGKIKIMNCDFTELSDSLKYDGIWACSSLLHIPKFELPAIFHKIESALKSNGVFYCSFKQGNFEGMRNGRYFSDFNEDELCALIEESTDLRKNNLWKTTDARPNRSEIWLNSLWQKSPQTFPWNPTRFLQ